MSLSFLDFSVGVDAFFIGLNQISSFFSFKSSCQYQFTSKTIASKAKWHHRPYIQDAENVVHLSLFFKRIISDDFNNALNYDFCR